MNVRFHYNSIIAKIVTFISGYSTIMLFGSVFTEHPKLSNYSQRHEAIHVYQYQDCVYLGIGIASLIYMICLLLGADPLKLLWLILIPIFFYYLWYIVEYLYYRLVKRMNQKDAYYNIKFEIQAREIGMEIPGKWYTFMGWLKY